MSGPARAAAIVLLLAAVSLPLLRGLELLPVQRWDEARFALGAFEMSQRRDPIVATIRGEPDTANLKPPLQYWVLMASTAVIGPGTMALRLPSAAAAIATALLLLAVSAGHLRRPLLGAVAALVLVTSPGYAGHHIARTGDADALLVLWLTAGILALYLWLEAGARSDDRRLWLAAAAFALALLTKGVAALLPLPGVALGAVLLGRGRQAVRCRRLWLAAAAAVAPLLVWYPLREAAAPGYLANVLASEIGRMTVTVEEHLHPAGFYLRGLAWGRFLPWLYLLPLPLLVPLEARVRRLALFAAAVAAGHLAVISASSTKLTWYDAPFYPMAALVVAAGVDGLATAVAARAERWSRPGLTRLAVAVAVVALPWGAAVHRAGPPPRTPEAARPLDASWILHRLHRSHPELRRVSVLPDGYEVHLRAYGPILRHRGVELRLTDPAEIREGDVVLAASEEVASRLRHDWSVVTLGRHGGAELVRVASPAVDAGRPQPAMPRAGAGEGSP